MYLDRRAVLGGLAGLGAGGCTPSSPTEGAGVSLAPLDLSDLESAGDRIGVYAERGGELLGWRAEERFLYCSTFKLFLAAATLLRVQAGEESLARTVPVRAEDMLAHAPVTESLVGQSATISRLCQAVVEVSDNPAANILIREMGGLDAWRAAARAMGDEVVRIDRWELELNSPDGEMDTTTPRQAVANINGLFLGDAPLLDEANRRLLEGWMVASPTGPARIRAGAPANAAVAHKTGTSAFACNDIGFVRPLAGDPLVLAIYVQGAEADDATPREAIIAEVTRRVARALVR